MHAFPGQRRSALAANVESSLRHGSYFLGLVIMCQVVKAAQAVDAVLSFPYIHMYSVWLNTTITQGYTATDTYISL